MRRACKTETGTPDGGPADSGEVRAIGVDVGGTKIAGGVVRFPAGEVLLREVRPTRPERGPEAVLADVVALAGRLAQQGATFGQAPAGVGLGVPELVDPEGRITSGAVIDWRGAPLGERFRDLGTAVVEADVRAAARGEALFGAGRDFRWFVYVSVGTGISSCLVQDGRPFAGARGNALVLGSGPEVVLCLQCGRRITTVLEDTASGPALARSYNAAWPGSAASAEDVLAAAAAGEPEALRIATRAGEALGNRLGFLVNVLDPAALIVGGGLGLAGGVYWQALCEAARSAIWAANSRDVPLLPAALGTDAGLIGAASLVWRPWPSSP